MTRRGSDAAPRVREAGEAALLVSFDCSDSGEPDPVANRRAVALATAVRAARPAGIRAVVPAMASVAIVFDPLRVEPEDVTATVLAAGAGTTDTSEGRHVEVPVCYGGADGPDLGALATACGLPAADVIARHTHIDYRVFMLGFLPGFAYMGTVDAAIAAPRLATPRLRVPAGSVGIAGRQTGIYPMASPGGWALVGRTVLRPFDVSRTEPCLFRAGDRVRFRAEASYRETGTSSSGAVCQVPDDSLPVPGPRAVTVMAPGLLSTVQDGGRWGHEHLGVGTAGPMDSRAHARANALIGNGPAAATLEATIVGPDLRFETPSAIAIAGADLGAEIDGRMLSPGIRVSCVAGSRLRFQGRRTGARAYIAVEGGFDVPRVLGSRATHTASRLGGLGGRALMAGDRIPLGASGDSARPGRSPDADEPMPRGGTTVRVLPGPQADRFADAAFDLLTGTRFVVTSESNRMGYRLASEIRLPQRDEREMLSDVTFPGGLQVPRAGQPILLTADRPTTGGYPQIAVVIGADLPLVGQLAPGDWIAFVWCTRREAVQALRSAARADGFDA